jgi:hypothetical protein
MISGRNVGQVCNLRPIFNRPGAGPEKLLWSFDQPGVYRIHLDVSRDPLKLRSISNQPIVALNLPERLPGKAQDPVRLSGCETFERVSQLGDLHTRSKQEMYVIRHDDKRVELIITQALLPVTKSGHYHVCDLRHPKVQRSFAGVVEHSVHRQECLSGCRGFRETTAWRHTGMQPPGDEDGLAYRVKMWQTADAGGAHNREVEIGDENSLKINRPITNRPQVANLPYIGADGGSK